MLGYPGVAEAAVVGAENAAGLMEPIAWVIPADSQSEPSTGDLAGGKEVSAQALREFVASRLASYKAPTTIHLVRDLPRTHLGKVDRAALRAGGDVGGE